MTRQQPSVTTDLLKLWDKLYSVPGGRWLFSFILSRRVPYTGSIKCRVLELKPGFCKIKLPDRHRLRNHLNSIHAVALVNLGEVTSGLAILSGLAPNVRGIVVNISTEYLKKARGTLLAESNVNIPVVTEDMEFQVVANIFNHEKEIVARTTVSWRLGLIE